MSDEYLFVYGTLRKSAQHPMHEVLRAHTDYHSEARFRGLLYELSGYPGAVEASAGSTYVLGEVYKITNYSELFSALDDYEGCSENSPVPHEYVRKVLEVELIGGTMVNGAVLTAWIYIYVLDTDNRRLIESGDYLNP